MIAQDDIPLPKVIETEVLHSVMVLLVTRNTNETLATYSYLQPLDGHESIYRFDQGGQQIKAVTYYIGKYGACPAAISNIPSGFEMQPMMTNQCFPNLGGIIKVGVTCGIKGVVKICDVLVSSEVVNFDVAKDEELAYSPNREAIIISSQLNKLFTCPVQWPNDEIKQRLSDNGEHLPDVKSGVILSGPHLIDEQTIQKLVKNFAHEAIGIEIRGAEFLAVSQETTVNTIIVKAVCDFGDGKNIDKYQPTAALLAADLVHECLINPEAYEALKGLHNIRTYTYVCISMINQAVVRSFTYTCAYVRTWLDL